MIGIAGYDTSSRSLDANGNTTALQANGWMYGLGYDNTNRLTLIQQNGSSTMTYALNGKGERVRKAPITGTPTDFVYDASGKLLSEYTANTQRDYVWADNVPVAILDNPSQGSDVIHYVHTDNLGTPRAVTTQSGTAIWSWPYTQNPFGEQPASGSNYTLNLRYPGQYFDAETGLNYNMHRDYEAGTGRYVESDPAGLTAGPSNYAYVSESPLRYVDPTGLNGCGPDGGIISLVIPNNPLGFPFEHCCDGHDHRYDNCKGGSKLDCDMGFCGCVRRTCNYFSGGLFATCQRLSITYCEAVLYSKTADEQFRKAREKCHGPGCK